MHKDCQASRLARLLPHESIKDSGSIESVPVTTIAIPFVQSGSYPTRSGNLVRPLIDGEPAFRSICEAMETARRSIWITVTFLWQTCEMPDGRGTPFDVLDRAAARGIDVRIIFWRPDEETAWLRQNAFWGSTTHVELLARRRSGVKIRWDRAKPGFCQHQKSWLVDAGTPNETAFVGGINLNPNSMVAPGHRGEGHNHDVYLELAGPSVVDVHHNFVQRWNEASERLAEDGRWGTGSEANLPFPDRVPAECGAVVVQIQRTIHSGRYTDGRATPEGAPYDIASGERSNFEQYCSAILAARRSIYIENQQIDVPEIVDCLQQALIRGVQVVLLMPYDPEAAVQTQAKLPASLRPLARFGIFDNFMLAGIAGIGDDGHRKSVYVHSKLMLVDDEWATVGSCNLHRFSLFGNGEMNAAFSDSRTVRALRCELLQEHLAMDTSGIDDRGALSLFREIARQNRRKLEGGDPTWQGLAFELATGCNEGVEAAQKLVR
jgi:cardiolipin synthase A/B